MVSKEEGKEEKVIKSEDVVGKKWKREKGTGEERVLSQEPNFLTIPLSPVHH